MNSNDLIRQTFKTLFYYTVLINIRYLMISKLHLIDSTFKNCYCTLSLSLQQQHVCICCSCCIYIVLRSRLFCEATDSIDSEF